MAARRRTGRDRDNGRSAFSALRKTLPGRAPGGSRGINRKLAALAGVGAAFFLLWLAILPLGIESLWPLLAVPVVVAAWLFFEAGALLAAGAALLLLLEAAPPSPLSGFLVLSSFAALGLVLGRSHRRQLQSHRRLLRSSLTDALTGLHNYGYFMDSLEREICRVARYGGAVTIVMFDIDHFKNFNDRFGHQAGNEALRAVGGVIRREKRESDLAARFGGEEFALLIPGDEDAGLETANRIRTAISGTAIPIGGASARITISAGVSSYPLGASSREQLLGQADQLLYLSKRNGRDRVSVAPTRRRLAVM